MIKRSTIFALLFLALFTGATLFETLYPSKKMKNIQEALTEKISIPQKSNADLNQQMRYGVSKDLWITEKDGTRLHHHIESPQSILIAIPQGNRIELVEKMVGMQCYFQEKLEDEGGEVIQTIRHLESEEGTYRYTDHHFDAHEVLLALYRLPGETLTTHLSEEAPFLKGVAKEVTLSFSEGAPHFHAEKFRAHIHKNFP